ncbi:FAD-dependent oxidoreductase [Rhodococcus hoagii]|nr:FAD-dependent oxidoreductase [Prescottella equi]
MQDNPKSALHADRRRRELDSLGDRGDVDVLVIGGGVTGVGTALDAASRGLRTVLVDKHDLASARAAGAPNWRTADCATWRPATSDRPRERRRTRHPHDPYRTAPGAGAAAAGAAAAVGEHVREVAGPGGIPRRRRAARHRPDAVVGAAAVPPVDAERAAQLAPAVRRDGLRGGLLAYDGQLVDDARLVVALARTAAAHAPPSSPASAPTTSPATRPSARRADRRGTDDPGARRRQCCGGWAGEVDPDIRLKPAAAPTWCCPPNCSATPPPH